MSACGALIDSPVAPEPDSKIELIRGTYVAEGRVVWQEANRCGIRFLSKLSVNDWLAPIEAQPGFAARNDRRKPVGPALTAPAALHGRDAPRVTVHTQDLLQVARLVEQTARTLARHPDFLRERMTEGRNLISAMQILSRLCDPVRG